MKPLALWSRRLDDLEELLEGAGFRRLVEAAARVILKPNLIDGAPYPVTSDAGFVFRVAEYVRQVSPRAEIVVAEGCGAPGVETHRLYRKLGYTGPARRMGIRLVDLNEEPCRRLQRAEAAFLREIHLPEIVFEGLLVSLPVLKAHSMAQVTLALKNMVGLLPPSRYSLSGHWRKSFIHRQLDRGIAELNLHRRPDFSVLDAREGMAEAHLWGPRCRPAPGVIAAGEDPVAVDALGAGLLGLDWRRVGHIRWADGPLGRAADGEVALRELG